jgi:hypothetical protein
MPRLWFVPDNPTRVVFHDHSGVACPVCSDCFICRESYHSFILIAESDWVAVFIQKSDFDRDVATIDINNTGGEIRGFPHWFESECSGFGFFVCSIDGSYYRCVTEADIVSLDSDTLHTAIISRESLRLIPGNRNGDIFMACCCGDGSLFSPLYCFNGNI